MSGGALFEMGPLPGALTVNVLHSRRIAEPPEAMATEDHREALMKSPTVVTPRAARPAGLRRPGRVREGGRVPRHR